MVPALILYEYLLNRGIVPARATHFTIMFCFTMGVTKGKWATLLEGLLQFKTAYDRNFPVEVVLPQLSERYANFGLRELADKMAAFLREKCNINEVLYDAFTKIPEKIMSPAEAHDSLIDDPETREPYVDLVRVDGVKLEGRVTANVPYPPGIPLMIAGEQFDKVHIDFLRGVQEWSIEFPGFELSVLGVQQDEDTKKLIVQCVKGEKSHSKQHQFYSTVSSFLLFIPHSFYIESYT